MVSPEELTALLERVRAATGPDRELDAAIGSTFLYHPYGPFHWLDKSPEAVFAPTHASWMGFTLPGEDTPRDAWAAPEYTASIDAALALTERLTPIGTMSSHSLNHSIARDGEEFWAFHVTYYHEDGHPPTFFCETANDAPSAIIGSALSALIAQAETP